MKQVLSKLETYLRDTLGSVPGIRAWKEEGHLPFFLRDRYGFFLLKLHGKSLLLMVDRSQNEDPPAAIRKQMELVKKGQKEILVYVREHITAYHRKRLVENKIPFVVPGSQMYLPILGVDFREHYPKPRPQKGALSPSAQAVLIHALLQSSEDLNPTKLAKRLGYSVMTMSRAFDELEAAELCQSSSRGRGKDRSLCFQIPKQDLWTQAEPLLRTPVKSRFPIHLNPGKEPPGPKAGLTALAHFSMLSEPDYLVVAGSLGVWKSLRQTEAFSQAILGEEGALMLEVWTYAPELFARDGWVDPLSLYLSLRDTKDERVQITLEQLKKAFPW